MPGPERGKTLYLRGLPETVISESKARAARRGITLTAYVAEILGRAVAADDEEPTEPGAELSADLRWYREHRDRLAARHAGEYLAVVDQQVIDHDQEFAPLARRVRERFGTRPVLMPKCVPGGRVVNLPSPRVNDMSMQVPYDQGHDPPAPVVSLLVAAPDDDATPVLVRPPFTPPRSNSTEPVHSSK